MRQLSIVNALDVSSPKSHIRILSKQISRHLLKRNFQVFGNIIPSLLAGSIKLGAKQLGKKVGSLS